MNKKDAGSCYTNGIGRIGNGAFFEIKSDSDDNHEVTGEGHKQMDDRKRFTCVELEVYGV
jgi:hypothetical protein